MELTPEQEKAYLENPNVCPICQSSNITGEEWDGGDGSQKVSCDDCSARWYDLYKLIGVQMIES